MVDCRECGNNFKPVGCFVVAAGRDNDGSRLLVARLSGVGHSQIDYTVLAITRWSPGRWRRPAIKEGTSRSSPAPARERERSVKIKLKIKRTYFEF